MNVATEVALLDRRLARLRRLRAHPETMHDGTPDLIDRMITKLEAERAKLTEPPPPSAA